MTAIVTYDDNLRRNRVANAILLLLVALAHIALLSLMLDSSAKPQAAVRRSSPTIATWNLLASSEAPPARSSPDPKASPISIDLDAPTIEIHDLPPVAAGLGAMFASDPYAGAAPVGDGFAKPVTAPEPVQRPTITEPVGDDAFSRWLADLRARLVPTLTQESGPLKPVRAEIFALPTGGFSTARIAQGSGDAAIDRKILVDLMQHKELVERGRVTAPKWLALPAIDITPTSG